MSNQSYDFASKIYDIADYPTPGVVFKDITPLFSDPEGLCAITNAFANHFKPLGVTKVLGAEARGFLVGPPVAYSMGCGFVPARKPNKLPREVYRQSYELEYGSDELQIHQDALQAGDRVLIVDDLIATGGTAIACANLIKQAGAELVGFAFIMELCFLNPREVLSQQYNQEIFTLVKVD